MPSRQRILAVRLSALGDLILAQAAIHELRLRLPDADITWVIDERFRSVADAVPAVRAVGIKKPRSLIDYWSFRRAFAGERFDVVLAMQANFRTNLLYGALKAKRKIGFDQRRARDGHGVFVGETIKQRDEHLLDGFFQFGEALGVQPPLSPRWPQWTSSEALKWWTNLQLRGPYVVVHTGTSKPERCWPASQYQQLAIHFATNPRLPVVLTGGSSLPETEASAAFRKACPWAMDLLGKTDLDQLRYIITRASVVVSPDTAAVHIARTADVSVVGLYAVARPELSGPYRKLNYTVNAYPEAVRRFSKKEPTEVDWHHRVHTADAMSLIEASVVWQNVERALLDRARSE